MQRAIEQRGVPTVSLSVALDVTLRAKPPRAIFAPFMMGHHFGVPFHKAVQRRMIDEALRHLIEAKESAEVKHIPLTWAQVRKEGIAIEKNCMAKP